MTLGPWTVKMQKSSFFSPPLLRLTLAWASQEEDGVKSENCVIFFIKITYNLPTKVIPLPFWSVAMAQNICWSHY